MTLSLKNTSWLELTDMLRLSHVTAVLTTFAVLVFLAGALINTGISVYFLFSLVLLGVMNLLVRLLLLPGNKELWSKRQFMILSAHVCLHLVPFSYLVLQWEASPSMRINGLYYLPLAVFFYTGRRTWQAFFNVFGSKIYKLFFLGNTGMIVSLGVLMGLGFLTEEAMIVTLFQRLLMLYFSVHLLIVGGVVIKIENDIAGVKVAP